MIVRPRLFRRSFVAGLLAVVAALLASLLLSATAANAAQPGTLQPGQGLAVGQSLASANGRYNLVHQTDGNVTLTELSTGAVLWYSRTAGKSTSNFVFQTDGNLVLYGTDGKALYDTRTSGKGATAFAVQDDGNLVVYAGGTALWASSFRNSGTEPVPGARGFCEEASFVPRASFPYFYKYSGPCYLSGDRSPSGSFWSLYQSW